VLDFGLNHANSAVVMATAKLFLHYTLNFTHQHQQVWGGGLGNPGLCYKGSRLPAHIIFIASPVV
jgi:hypothetical protein